MSRVFLVIIKRPLHFIHLIELIFKHNFLNTMKLIFNIILFSTKHYCKSQIIYHCLFIKTRHYTITITQTTLNHLVGRCFNFCKENLPKICKFETKHRKSSGLKPTKNDPSFNLYTIYWAQKHDAEKQHTIVTADLQNLEP